MFKNEAELRGAAWGVSNGLLAAGVTSASIDNIHGHYLWQIELIGAELIAGVVLTIALVASQRSAR